MAQVKGLGIVLISMLMGVYQNERKEADDLFFAETGKHIDEVDPEDWYDTKWIKFLLDAYVKASPSKEFALVTFGKQMYPTLKRGNMLPTHLKTPLDYIKYDAEFYFSVHKGPDVLPKKIIKSTSNEIIIEATTPGYDSKVNIGIFLGIFKVLQINTAKVVQTKSQEKGDNTSEFHMIW